MNIRIGDPFVIRMTVRNNLRASQTFMATGFIYEKETGSIVEGMIVYADFKPLESKEMVLGPMTMPSAQEGITYNLFGGVYIGQSLVAYLDSVDAAKVIMMGDVNADNRLDIFDLASVGKAFGKKYGEPGYDREADMNNDGIINIFDLAAVGLNFGREIK
jgi:hypothetical protein